MSTFETVAKLKLASIKAGLLVNTIRYNATGDGGSNYLVETAAVYAATPDEVGDFTLVNGNIAVLQHNGSIDVEQFGATGDGVTDDFIALSAANLSSAGTIRYADKTYYTPGGTVPFASKKRYVGVFRKTTIFSDVDSRPTAASEAWIDAAVSPGGQCTIENINCIGLVTNLNQKALVIHDFFTTLKNVQGATCGGGGIQLTKMDQFGTDAGGSLVENRLIRCEVRVCGGILYDLGEFSNGKLTDGWMTDCTVIGQAGASVTHIFCGQSAGWNFDGNHLYGEPSEVSVDLVAPNNTKFINFYLESFKRIGVQLQSCQGNTEISGSIKGIGLDETLGDIRYVSIGRSGIVDPINVKVAVDIVHDLRPDGGGGFLAPLPASAVFAASSGIVGAAMVTARGTDLDSLTDVGEFFTGYKDDIAQPNQFTLTSDEQTGRLINGFAFPICWNSTRLSGNAAQQVDFKLPNILGDAKMTMEVTILANIFDEGTAIRAEYKAMLLISGKFVGDVSHILVELVAPGGTSGFSSNPVFSIVNPTDRENLILRGDFTFSDVDATGAMTAIGIPNIASD